jgi:diguanylate cyclase (GGDEF)-like protein
LDYATNHPLNELMQRALDEIGELTGSPIGFYHFVDEDQNVLSLQAWSTRTLAEFCKAEGKGMHYSIEEAGVWADSVHQRKPVVHNEYTALPHRKGLPEGHADIIRELVVPTMRDGRVVAILGVGNKPFDYDEQDVELVSYIADLVWSILEQKRADEQILELNTKLERLAMTDELTGLMNRRSFFIQGENEIKRAQRHQTPLSLLMLDVDRFKAVNDRYGHDAGDRVLQHVALKLIEIVREIDMVARMGGEEFSLLLPNTGAENAVKLAERVRLAIERGSCQIQDQSINVTVSIGVASYSKDTSSLEAILRHADDSMYQAKNQGRNRVVVLD